MGFSIDIISGTLAVLLDQPRYFPKKAGAFCPQEHKPHGTEGRCSLRWVGGEEENKFQGFCPALGQWAQVYADQQTMDGLLSEAAKNHIDGLTFS
ncbi:hypothetical protein CO083_04725 [Candidatus Roizmanbacteria bacterium CG_4_9_14_0_8_um_filter_34_12]|uniref:Uncharacterized protein n=3 Tax=Candidatus Roizmaniibacteriota TaxID=1752723 RepID=A0A2M7LQJ8_9BACT|nr:hypothetical protein [Candidatus Roizmanbacteria bacterium]PIX70329.1 MAG: hypothetical protein COZ39_04655 [Candidatus Roizmanbacteria bacterium CG_4_10_14_3_um_filter_33_21]PJB87880.1 MAG: hypothetical protein CO083_04725 [Candidatus Roizmanbacteria bacterium CG_4_9_14_0_8_um_filter_34_12]